MRHGVTRNDKDMTTTNILDSKSIQATYVVAAILCVDKLTGRSAIVTGGASGIGRACAIRLAREGAGTVIGDIRDEQAAETVDLVRAAGGLALLGELRPVLSRRLRPKPCASHHRNHRRDAPYGDTLLQRPVRAHLPGPDPVAK